MLSFVNTQWASLRFFSNQLRHFPNAFLNNFRMADKPAGNERRQGLSVLTCGSAVHIGLDRQNVCVKRRRHQPIAICDVMNAWLLRYCFHNRNERLRGDYGGHAKSALTKQLLEFFARSFTSSGHYHHLDVG